MRNRIMKRKNFMYIIEGRKKQKYKIEQNSMLRIIPLKRIVAREYENS